MSTYKVNRQHIHFNTSTFNDLNFMISLTYSLTRLTLIIAHKCIWNTTFSALQNCVQCCAKFLVNPNLILDLLFFLLFFFGSLKCVKISSSNTAHCCVISTRKKQRSTMYIFQSLEMRAEYSGAAFAFSQPIPVTQIFITYEVPPKVSSL